MGLSLRVTVVADAPPPFPNIFSYTHPHPLPGPPLASLKNVRVSPDTPRILGDWPDSAGNQSEVKVAFNVPSSKTTLGVGIMTANGVATVEAYIEFVPSPPSPSSSPSASPVSWEVSVGIRPSPSLTPHQHHQLHEHTHAHTHAFTARLPLLPSDKSLDMHVFVDNVMAEVFFMGGRVALTAPLETTQEAGFTLFTRGGDQAVIASEVSVWHLQSTWVSPNDVRTAPRPKRSEK